MSTRTLRSLLIAMTVLGATQLASASAALTVRTDPGGPLLSGSTVIRSTSGDPAVIDHNAVATFTCTTTTFRGDLNSRSSPTAITGRLTELTFTNCSNYVTPFQYPSGCALHAPGTAPAMNFTAQQGGAFVEITDATLRCPRQDGAIGGVCYWTFSSMLGATLNNPTTLDVPAASATSTTATGDATLALCPSAASLKFRVTHLVQDGTNRTVTFTTT